MQEDAAAAQKKVCLKGRFFRNSEDNNNLDLTIFMITNIITAVIFIPIIRAAQAVSKPAGCIPNQTQDPFSIHNHTLNPSNKITIISHITAFLFLFYFFVSQINGPCKGEGRGRHHH